MVLKDIKLKNLTSDSSKIYVRLDHNFLIEMLKKASENEKPHRNKIFCRKIKVKFNDERKFSPIIDSWIKFKRAIPLENLKSIRRISKIPWEEIEKNILSLKSGMAGAEVSIKFPIKIEREIGSIVGHLLGDGTIDKKYQQVAFYNSEPDLLKEFESFMEKIFGIKPRIWMQRKKRFEEKSVWEKRLSEISEVERGNNYGLFYPTICGLILNIIFNNFALGINKNVTDNIKKTNKKFKASLIRAFFDDEGTVGQRNLRVFQDRKNILEDFRNFLIGFKIYPGEVKTTIKREKDRYYFTIHRKSNLNKFRSQIGFTSKKKMNKLKEISIIKNYKNSK